MKENFYEDRGPSLYEGWHQQCRGVTYPSIQMGESPFEGSLFSRKEMYIQACTSSGKLRSSMLMSPSARAKAEYNNLHLINGMHLTQRYGFPILSPCKECPELHCVPYSSRNEYGKKQFGVHFLRMTTNSKTHFGIDLTKQHTGLKTSHSCLLPTIPCMLDLCLL